MADTVNQRYPGLRLIITDNLKEDMHYTGRTEGEQVRSRPLGASLGQI
jgi:hypothetical protein